MCNVPCTAHPVQSKWALKYLSAFKMRKRCSLGYILVVAVTSWTLGGLVFHSRLITPPQFQFGDVHVRNSWRGVCLGMPWRQVASQSWVSRFRILSYLSLSTSRCARSLIFSWFIPSLLIFLWKKQIGSCVSCACSVFNRITFYSLASAYWNHVLGLFKCSLMTCKKCWMTRSSF